MADQSKLEAVELAGLVRQMRRIASVGVPAEWPPGARALLDQAVRLADLAARLADKIEALEGRLDHLTGELRSGNTN